ncbi:hypothetical protein BH20ACT22_BH20ACT22_15240 [soil metagenome]
MDSAALHVYDFVDVLSLAYHEARNVRHLIKAGHLSPESFGRLRSLPTNRLEAWREIQSLREQAKKCTAIHEAAALFGEEFNITLSELVHLYRDPHWRGVAYGGNRWAGITAAIEEVLHMVEAGEDASAANRLREIPLMDHNTGRVQEKLADLDAALGVRTSFFRSLPRDD